jgi:Kef-type K+ transport system membrane component KefB
VVVRKDWFIKLGLKRVCLIGLFLEIVHVALLSHFPELSPHYTQQRQLWARLLMLSEYLGVMTTLLLAISHILNAVSTRELRDANPSGLLLCIILWTAFLWVYR